MRCVRIWKWRGAARCQRGLVMPDQASAEMDRRGATVGARGWRNVLAAIRIRAVVQANAQGRRDARVSDVIQRTRSEADPTELALAISCADGRRNVPLFSGTDDG